MLKLNEKYVFHIPVHKFENERVTRINMENLMDELINQLNENGYHSFYMTKVKGHYKDRCFDEMLITVFASKEFDRTLPDEIFKRWFRENNSVLVQESFAYEHNGTLYIERLESSN